MRKRVPTITIVKIIIWLLPALLFLWIGNKNFSPSGTLATTYTPGEESRLVNNFASKEKDVLIGYEGASILDPFQLITQSPLYFEVEVPRLFPKATVSMLYKNADQQPIINLGVKQANGGYYFKEFANYSKEIERLGDYWHEYRDGDTVLFQKDPYRYEKVRELLSRYQSKADQLVERYGGNETSLAGNTRDSFLVDQEELDSWYAEQLRAIKTSPYTFEFTNVTDFLTTPPDFSRVVRHNFELSDFLALPGYIDLETPSFITTSVRGAHEMFTYLGDGENLDFTFTIQDANRHQGADPFTVTVYNSANKAIHKEMVDDDGETAANGNILPERTLRLHMSDLPFGVYRLEIEVQNDDVFIKRIESQQSLIVFKGHVYLTDNKEYRTILGDREFSPTTVFTSSPSISARTAHDAGLQTLVVGGAALPLSERHVDYGAHDLEGVTKIISPQNDVKIEGEGYFALAEEQFFDPDNLFTPQIDSIEDVDSYDFVIAHYPEPVTVDGWLLSAATIEVPYLFFGHGEKNVAELLFTMPGLPEGGRTLKVKSVTITFEKEPITIGNLFDRFKNAI